MTQSRVQTGQVHWLLQNRSSTRLLQKSKRSLPSMLLMVSLLLSVTQTIQGKPSPFPTFDSIFKPSDMMPRTSAVSMFEEIKLQRKDGGGHPRVGQTESCKRVVSTTPNFDCITETNKMMCTQGPQYNNTCTVPGAFYQQDTIIELDDIENLVLIDPMTCKIIRTGEFCSITIRLKKPGPTSLWLANKAYIQAKTVIIDSPETGVFIKKESKIIAPGSYSSMGSSSGNEPMRGASFVGEGGYCGAEDLDYRVYGRFDMSNPDNPYDPEVYQSGSMSEWDPPHKSTAGGGYIYMNIDSTHFEGDSNENTLEAIGWPAPQFSKSGTYHGGSGGYIHLKTSNVHGKENNAQNQEWRIAAFGGNGQQYGFGGSGGIIIVDGKFGISQNNYLAYGGKAGDMVENMSGCGTGAAGTVYYKQIDFLYISNGNRKTNKKTFIQAKVHPQSSYPEENMVAKILWIEGRANVAIQNTAMDSIIFPLVRVEDASTMIFDFKETTQLTIKYTSTFSVDSQSTIDTTSIVLRTRFMSYDPNEDSYLQLGKVYFSGDIDLEATQVELQQSLIDPSVPLILDNSQNGRMIILADQIHIMDQVELKAPNIFLYANKSIHIMPGCKIQSLKAYACNTRDHTDWIPKMFKCMSNNYDQGQLSFESFRDYYNEVHNTNVKDIYSMVPTIMYWWNIYIMTGGQLTIHGTKVLAPKVGLCGSDITLVDTLVDTSWKGCPHDKGIGSIDRIGDCAGPGAAHGGDGGYGGLERIDRPGQDTVCFDHYPKGRYDGKEAAYEGSGGTSGDDMKENGGSGGGVIWSHTPGTTMMNSSSFKADGQSGRLSQAEQVGSGGGAGGSIYITTLNMVGNGLVSAMGGAGLRGGGGGSGGRFIMNYLKSFLSSSNPRQSFYWIGHHDVSGGVGGAVSRRGLPGQSGELGTAYHTKCFPGYEGVFCKACDIGFYKYDYSYGECQPCINKPKSSYYTMKAEDTAQCDYECDKLLESSKYNPDCLDPISLEIQRLGGMIPFFALLGLFLIFSLIIFSMLTYRSQQMNEEIKDLPEVLYYVWEDDYQGQVNIRGRTTQFDFSMNDDCVWSHTHRMYLIGSNTINYPFFIPKDFPRDALKKADRENLLKFIDIENARLRYTFKEKMIFIVIYALYPPLANQFHLHLRKKKFTMLQDDLYHNFAPQFWGDKTDNKTIRLGVSQADYMMAYIDFLDFGQTRQNWEGVKLPMAILLAGNGTFNQPYNIDFQTDVFAKSLVLLRFDFFREKLPIWLQNFNTQLSKLSFYKLEVTVMRDLTNVVEWIEKANMTMFNHFDVKAVMYIIENQYTEIDGGQFKQKRRSFPLETIFFDAFPEMYLNLIRYVKQRLITGKSEIRIALVFKKQSKSKQVQTEMRIKMMKEKDNQSAYQTAINRQESVLFDDTDKDAEEDRVKFEQKKTGGSDGQITQSSATMGASDSNATLASDASTSSGDKKKKAVKLVNKTLRAFSISIESSKAFELTIRKPRRKCKHHVSKFKAQIYSIYLLLVKQQGSSPKTKDLTFFFILYASMLALDLLLLLNYTLHIFFPAENFSRFGWAFCLLVLGVPYISPAMAFTAAFFGSPELMKVMSNFNSFEILINIPLVAFVSACQDDDPVYYLLLMFMVLVKMGLSATSAKVRQYLTNPRYSKNAQKLKKILKRQKEKIQKREDILGREATQELAQSQVDEGNVSTTSSLLTGQPTGSAPLGENQAARRNSLLGQNQNVNGGQAALDKDTLRDMLLE